MLYIRIGIVTTGVGAGHVRGVAVAQDQCLAVVRIVVGGPGRRRVGAGKPWLAIQAGVCPPATAPVQVLGEWSLERSPTKIVLLSPSVTFRVLWLLR